MSRPEPALRGSRFSWREVALLAFSLLCSAFFAESYLRLFNPIDSPLLEMHPRYLFRLVPGARRLFFREGEDGADRVLVTVNSAGFRGPELRHPKQGLRVIVYGDSFVMSNLSPVAETFPAQLARKIQEAILAPVEAVNAGVIGYGPDQECLRIEDEIGPLAPDLIVVAVFAGNDFGDLVRDKIYRLESDGSLRLNRYTLSQSTVDNFPDPPGEAPWSMFWRGLQYLGRPSALGRRERKPQRFSSQRRIRDDLEKAREEYEDFVVRGNDEVLNLFGDTYNADVSLTPEAPSARYSKAVMEQVLARIEDIGRDHGVPVLLVFIPSATDVSDEPRWTDWARAAAAISAAYRPEALTDVLAGIAERRGFEYVDLFRLFRAAPARKLFFATDPHWNAAGQALAAEAARNKIVADGLLRPRFRP